MGEVHPPIAETPELGLFKPHGGKIFNGAGLVNSSNPFEKANGTALRLSQGVITP